MFRFWFLLHGHLANLYLQAEADNIGLSMNP